MPKTNTAPRTRRGVTINLRADEAKRSLIDRAAEKLGKNRSEFMLEAACREATTVLLDQRLFLLDEKAFKRCSNGFTDHSKLGAARINFCGIRIVDHKI